VRGGRGGLRDDKEGVDGGGSDDEDAVGGAVDVESLLERVYASLRG